MAELVRDVILRDGTALRLRSPSAGDEGAMRTFFAGLDAESTYRRFHGYVKPRLVARHYAQADGESRVALLAHRGERVVAVAGYERLREPRAAEVAFAIHRDEQGRGLGTRMLEQLAEHAAAHGLERFDAEVLADNKPMLGVFRSAGFAVRREGTGGEIRLVLDIRPTEHLAERIAQRDHVATAASLRPLLAPASVAVVGASAQSGSIGGRIVRNVLLGGYRGVVMPVNRSGGVVHSIRAVRSVGELPEAPDLAVLSVPAAEVAAAAEEAAQAGVRALLVVASGFSEVGPEGRAREEQLLAVARAHGLRLLGPNSLGILNTDPGVRLDATIGDSRPRAGRVAISSQSGALGLGLLGLAEARGLGVASFVALGNRADVSTNDLLEGWEEDERVGAIVLYVESFGNPRRFAQIARRVSRRRPILLVKGRRYRAGGPGARSHTAAALGSEAVADAGFRQAGIQRLSSTAALFDLAQLLDTQPLPAGRCLAVITNAGGLGTLTVDAALTRALEVPELGEERQGQLEAALPRAQHVSNPIDLSIASGPAEYARALRLALADDGIDAVVALYAALAGGDAAAILDALDEAAAGADKPVVAAVLGADGRAPARPAPGPVPNLGFPEACVAALAAAADRRDWLSRPLGQPLAPDAVDPEAARAVVDRVLAGDGEGWLGADAVLALLGAYAIPALPAVRCGQAEEAVVAAEAVAGPVALKADLPAPALAADVDAVLLGLEGAAAVRSGWAELQRRVSASRREWAGATVQPLAGPGADVLVGAIADPDLGAVVALGVGGRQAGLSRDVAFRLAPTRDVEVDELLDAAPALTVWLDGVRGSPPLDRPALGELVGRFARLVADVPEVVEVDLNPVRVLAEGCVVLDARVRVAHRPPDERRKTW